MRQILPILAVSLVLIFATGCKRSADERSAKPTDTTAAKDTHKHADGSTHADHGERTAAGKTHGHGHEGEMGEGHDHAHDEVSLGTVKIGEMEVELAQGHGKVEAGKEGHLVVNLPYKDNGATIVRAWIGTDDRTMSLVGKGEYAPSHDDYDIHAVAPDPLPENTMWWIEIEKPDGTRTVGSAKPLVD
jgi:hypothetical protein